MIDFTSKNIFIGTAGWTLPPSAKSFFEIEGSHLERYAKVFNCVEINSAFYREHKFETYRRWAQTVPANFKFSVKLSRSFTQTNRLTDPDERLTGILSAIGGLQAKWAVLLVQLPPSLVFDVIVARQFFNKLKSLLPEGVKVQLEPRNRSWSSERAIELLVTTGIGKVLADPEPCPLSTARRPPVETSRYYRLHGSPVVYKSRYPASSIARLADKIINPISTATSTWCIFDNTSYGHATENALELQQKLFLRG